MECILCKDLTDIDLDQSSTLGSQYKQMKKHHRQLEHLSDEISVSKNLLDKRTIAYDRIKTGLENIGVKKENLDRLDDQLKRLKVTVDECKEVKDQCDEILQVETNNLDKRTREIKAFIDVFDDNGKQMLEREPEFIQALYAFFGLAGGAAAGAVGGGALGTAVLPVVGTAVGALAGTVIGGISGFMWGLVKGEEGHAKVERKVQNYRETISRTQAMNNNLKDLLRD